jgi:hypothetical protein
MRAAVRGARLPAVLVVAVALLHTLLGGAPGPTLPTFVINDVAPPGSPRSEADTINSAGDVAFTAKAGGPDGLNAIYVVPGSSIVAGTPTPRTVTVSRLVRGKCAGDQPTPIGGTFCPRGVPSINDPGQVAFTADAVSDVAILGSGIFLASPVPGGYTFSEVVVSAVKATGGLTNIGDPHLNNQGQVAFTSSTGPDQIEIVVGSPGPSGYTFSQAAAEGETDPSGGLIGTPSHVFSFNDSSQVAFTARTGNAGQGVFLAETDGNGYSLTRVVAEGDPNPAGGSFEFQSYEIGPLALNNAGEVAFWEPAGHKGFYVASAGGEGFAVVAVAREFDPSPAGGELRFLQNDGVAINDSGAVAFNASFCVPGCTSFSNGLFYALPSGSAFAIGVVSIPGGVPVNGMNSASQIAADGFVASPVATRTSKTLLTPPSPAAAAETPFSEVSKTLTPSPRPTPTATPNESPAVQASAPQSTEAPARTLISTPTPRISVPVATPSETPRVAPIPTPGPTAIPTETLRATQAPTPRPTAIPTETLRATQVPTPRLTAIPTETPSPTCRGHPPPAQSHCDNQGP